MGTFFIILLQQKSRQIFNGSLISAISVEKTEKQQKKTEFEITSAMRSWSFLFLNWKLKMYSSVCHIFIGVLFNTILWPRSYGTGNFDFGFVVIWKCVQKYFLCISYYFAFEQLTSMELIQQKTFSIFLL